MKRKSWVLTMKGVPCKQVEVGSGDSGGLVVLFCGMKVPGVDCVGNAL